MSTAYSFCDTCAHTQTPPPMWFCCFMLAKHTHTHKHTHKHTHTQTHTNTHTHTHTRTRARARALTHTRTHAHTHHTHHTHTHTHTHTHITDALAHCAHAHGTLQHAGGANTVIFACGEGTGFSDVIPQVFFPELKFILYGECADEATDGGNVETHAEASLAQPPHAHKRGVGVA
jgi:hypothetical protein